MADFKPFTQVSRTGIQGCLRQINAGKAGLLLWFFVTEMDPLGLVKASYERISDVTGMGAASIASQSRTLIRAGLVERLPDDVQDGISRWRVSDTIARYRVSSETKGGNGASFETEISETKDLTTDSVVVQESVVIDFGSESVKQQPLRASFETEISETKDRLPDDLIYLCEAYALLADGLTVETLAGWVGLYGPSQVVELARLYVHKRQRGRVGSPGWLRTALQDGWIVADHDFNRLHYMSSDQRAQAEREKWRASAEENAS